MKKQLIVMSIAAMASGAVFAAGAPVANQFSAGQPAIAAEVNENFQELANRTDINAIGVENNASNIAANGSAISVNADGVAVNAVGVSDNTSGISDNASDIATNTASIAALGGEINLKDLAVNEDVLSKRFVNVTSGSYRIDALIYDAQAKTLSQDIQFTNGSGQTYQTEKRAWEYGVGMVMKNYLHESHQTDFEMSVVYTPGLLFLKEKAIVGESWWSIYDLEITQVFEGESAVTTRQKGRKHTLIGLQDVSVPYGDFENCAVIEEKNANYALYYYCEGVGLARHISFSDDSFELISAEGISIPIGEKIGSDFQLESLTTQ